MCNHLTTLTRTLIPYAASNSDIFFIFIAFVAFAVQCALAILSHIAPCASSLGCFGTFYMEASEREPCPRWKEEGRERDHRENAIEMKRIVMRYE